jgi:transcriptional regulator GlxA family with amidase domain
MQQQIDSEHNRPLCKTPTSFAFVPLDNFSMICFANAIEPLRSANRQLNKQLFTWHVISPEGEPIRASNGVKIAADQSFLQPPHVDCCLLIGGLTPKELPIKKISALLHHYQGHKTILGGLSTATEQLAQLGLLDNYNTTIHWENILSLSESYPELAVTPHLYEFDYDRITCSGGIASLDMMLQIISEAAGHNIATQVADQFIHARFRHGDENQKIASYQTLLTKSPKLAMAVGIMDTHLDTPLPTGAIAMRVGISLRQLERLFKKHENTTPQRYYLHLRIKEAQNLLRLTGHSMMNVALATGFTSQSHFSKCYRDAFGYPPHKERDETDSAS